MNRRPIEALAALAAAAIVLAACGGGDTSATAGQDEAKATTVTVQTFEFRPDPLTVEAGDTITFVNRDAIDHTVTSGTRDEPTPDVFDGQLPQKDARFELTLTEAGTYEYFCTVHPGPGMTGVIEVR